MASNDYHFITRWQVEGSPEEVYDIILDASQLPDWWPSVYLEAQVKERGDATGVGSVVSLYTKGFLPYTLRWDFRVTEAKRPSMITLEAWGDFLGRGIWSFIPRGPLVDITFDWKLSAQKPLLRSLSFLLKPIFSKNH